MFSSMISLPPRAWKADRSGLVESISADTSRTRGRWSCGSVAAQVERRVARIEVLDRAAAVEPGDAVGRRGGKAGAGAAGHQALQPPVGPDAAWLSPLGPRPGYSRTPLASSTSKRSGECSVCTARTCASLRQSSPARAGAAQRVDVEAAAAADRVGHDAVGQRRRRRRRRRARRRAPASPAAGRIQPSPIGARPSRRPACCSPVQWITGTRLKMPSKSAG